MENYTQTLNDCTNSKAYRFQNAMYAYKQGWHMSIRRECSVVVRASFAVATVNGQAQLSNDLQVISDLPGAH